MAVVKRNRCRWHDHRGGDVLNLVAGKTNERRTAQGERIAEVAGQQVVSKDRRTDGRAGDAVDDLDLARGDVDCHVKLRVGGVGDVHEVQLPA